MIDREASTAMIEEADDVLHLALLAQTHGHHEGDGPMIPWPVERGLCDEAEAAAAMEKALARLHAGVPRRRHNRHRQRREHRQASRTAW
jgi:hypothetical protein